MYSRSREATEVFGQGNYSTALSSRCMVYIPLSQDKVFYMQDE